MSGPQMTLTIDSAREKRQGVVCLFTVSCSCGEWSDQALSCVIKLSQDDKQPEIARKVWLAVGRSTAFAVLTRKWFEHAYGEHGYTGANMTGEAYAAMVRGNLPGAENSGAGRRFAFADKKDDAKVNFEDTRR